MPYMFCEGFLGYFKQACGTEDQPQRVEEEYVAIEAMSVLFRKIHEHYLDSFKPNTESCLFC